MFRGTKICMLIQQWQAEAELLEPKVSSAAQTNIHKLAWSGHAQNSSSCWKQLFLPPLRINVGRHPQQLESSRLLSCTLRIMLSCLPMARQEMSVRQATLPDTTSIEMKRAAAITAADLAQARSNVFSVRFCFACQRAARLHCLAARAAWEA